MLWQRVKDQKLSLKEYANIALANLTKEKDLRVLEMIRDSLSGSLTGDDFSVLSYWSRETIPLKRQYQDIIRQLEKIYFAQYQSSHNDTDEKSFWWDSFVSVATSKSAQNRILSMVKMKNGIDQDRRWNILTRLCRMGHSQCEVLLEKEKALDPSDRGLKNALFANAGRPYLENKIRWANDVLENQTLSLEEKTTISRALFPYDQKQFAVDLQAKVMDFAEKNRENDDLDFVTSVIRNMIFLNCSSAQYDRISGFMKAHADFPSPMMKTLKEMLFDDKRCQAIRAHQGL